MDYNNQALPQFLSPKELNFIKKQSWWIGDRNKPFLVKGGIIDNSYIIMATNMKTTWVSKAEKQQILMEQNKYNPTINQGNNKDQIKNILQLIEGPISQGTNTNKFSELKFQVNKEEDLIINMCILIEDFIPFKWEFYLFRLEENQEGFYLINSDLLSPLLQTVIALEKRGNYLKQKFLELENNYKQKLSQREKSIYKSPVEDSPNIWKHFVQNNDNDIQNLYNLVPSNFKIGESAQYFMAKFTLKSIGYKFQLNHTPQDTQQQYLYQQSLKRNQPTQDLSSLDREINNNYSKNLKLPSYQQIDSLSSNNNFKIPSLKIKKEDDENYMQQTYNNENGDNDIKPQKNNMFNKIKKMNNELDSEEEDNNFNKNDQNYAQNYSTSHKKFKDIQYNNILNSEEKIKPKLFIRQNYQQQQQNEIDPNEKLLIQKREQQKEKLELQMKQNELNEQRQKQQEEEEDLLEKEMQEVIEKKKLKQEKKKKKKPIDFL
ncbi:hypothetical protein PPERSA_01345 [Pseudocohnilembus persalinus]|uniref:XLF-like N-terminal domain-containing protein n=1 Tax=Pseudocohnilembus persalinus TaxID=266149 RepID=A0A0V0QGV0_PSEPJ|nr:hypothetical protein PPERSA_01345 [Pseudocohnilembus persalinus]|eukprot:KRX01442.1 hypothetical protein PPERSA_01345 [Pseudocohnilembus persalinus]